MKDDEYQLLAGIELIGRTIVETRKEIETGEERDKYSVRDLIKAMGLNEKRANYIIEKWSRKDWYNYGVSWDLGWLEDRGLDALKEETKRRGEL